MRNDGVWIASLLAGLLAVVPQPAASQSYQFTRILDSSTPRPDGRLPRFYIDLARTTPSFDGRWVVFRDPGPQNEGGSYAAIWSFDTQDGASPFHKLVDFNTLAPEGTGTFNNLLLTNSAPIVRNGTVIFQARDSAARQGLYSMPAGGGVITKIAGQNTADPSGGAFTVFDGWDRQMGGFSFDGFRVAFNASGSTMILGNYAVKPDGSALQIVADRLVKFAGGNIIGFYTPAISGSNVVMLGTDGHMISQTYPGSNGYNGIYLGTPGGDGAVTELLNSNSQLPGNTNPNFSIRFDWPALAFDGDLVVFRATDWKSATTTNPMGHFGLYSTDLTSHAIRTIADVLSPPPGIPKGKLTDIARNGVAASQGSVLYPASAGPGASALYLWRSGVSARIVGTSDVLDGRTVLGLNEPGIAALYGSSFVFVADFGGLNQSLYLATPAAGTPVLAAVVNSASNGGAAIAPGEIVTVFGANMGPAALTYSAFDASGRLPAGDGLAGVHVLFNGIAAPLIYASDKYHAVVTPFGLQGTSAEVVVKYNGLPPSNAIVVPVVTTAPGVFAADMTGSGPGAIQNIRNGIVTYNSTTDPAAPGEDITLWLTGLGALTPAPTDGWKVSGAVLPQLQYPVSVTIGGRPADITYQGPGPEQVAGMYQVNCVVPAGTPAGAAVVVVTADGRSSQPNLTVAVK